MGTREVLNDTSLSRHLLETHATPAATQRQREVPVAENAEREPSLP
jgi:hypothetical protein